MQAEALDNLQDALRKTLAKEGLSEAIAALKKALPEQTEKYNLVFQLETRLNRINKERIKGIISLTDLELAYNRLSDDLLNLISGLETSDLDPNSGRVSRKNGSVLYQIPRTMKLDAAEEYRCIVRLAFNEELIVERIDLSKDTEVKPIRVSEIMEVELKDPNESPAFKIRTINSVEQFLEEQAYTEWIFYVNPTRAGKLPLLLVVAVKEYIKDRPVRREIVLEELVNVVADTTEIVAETTNFQSTGYQFVYTTAESRKGNPVISTFGSGKYSVVTSVLLLLIFVVGIWALGLRLGWWNQTPVPPPPPQTENGTGQRGRSRADDQAEPIDSSAAQRDSVALVDQVDTLHRRQKTAKPAQPLSPGPSKDPSTLRKVPNGKVKPVSPLNQKKVHVEKTGIPPLAPPLEESLSNSKSRKSGFMMVKVEGGEFKLGKHYPAKNCGDGAAVSVLSFRLGKYEITQTDWIEIMGKNPAFKKRCADCPVENVSWNDVQEFIQKASKLKGKKYRLPYEVEWEYAASGGRTPHGFMYAGSKNPGEVAWFNTIKEYTHKVGTKKANNLELYDMSGNVREWCQGTYPPYLNCNEANESKKPLRGGSWVNPRGKIRVISRSVEKPSYRDQQSGLRLIEER